MLSFLKQEKFALLFRSIPSKYVADACKAAYEGGVRIFEIAFDPSKDDTIYETQKSIETVYETLGRGIEVYAGTCVKKEYVDAAASSGAKAIISPGTQNSVINRTKELGLISVPGASTPTEILAAHEAGADIVKIFPVLPDDVRRLQVTMSPLSHIPFMPTGGVNPDTIAEFLKTGATALSAGVTVISREIAENRDFELVKKNAKAHIDAIRSFAK
ncbi:MAG: bifunctional 4-hydroxy-2-oxoglutarate aldolase/2-dehydro-3-deoxy-phosphogluconate aldolase [Clostridia bacterium]|nr:bifunctional 4-hydroxy-2-oxoglutarate aldolase/2-dehydro-3-deoxy-phosphogluconate aldolase [Clostridia bacterium]